MNEKTIDLNTLSQQELESVGFKIMKERDTLIARVQNLNQALLEIDAVLAGFNEEPVNAPDDKKAKKPKA